MTAKNDVDAYFGGNYEPFYFKFLPSMKRIGGDEFASVCSFHEDQNPSLNVNVKKGTYFCHGCNKKGDIYHFYAKLHGLSTGRDFHKVIAGIVADFGIPTNGAKPSTIKKVYDYKDLAGTVIHQTVRMDPKAFKQRRPSAQKGWTWNLSGIEPLLYRLPEITKAEEVIICEGEKDCDNLASLGFQATTCPMGAGKWRDSYSDTLKGKRIVLIPDNDKPGREHMTKISALLDAHSIKWIDLPGVPNGGDASDWIESFPSKEEAAERLAAMIEGAPVYSPPKELSLEDIVLPVEDFLSLQVARKAAFLAPWLTEQSINLLVGWRGTGKTWLALGMLDAITRGEPFACWQNEKPAACLFLDGEMPISDVQDRLKAFPPGHRREPLYIYSDAHSNLMGLPRAHLASDVWRQKMRGILIGKKIKLWVVDNLASLASGLDENSKRDWDPINSWLLELRFAGISTVMLHHTNKEGGQRGTSGREDNLDTSIILRTPTDYTPEDGCRFILHFSKARVPTKALAQISDSEFKLIEEDGLTTWTYGDVKKQRRNEILRSLGEGAKQKDIALAMSITKGTVSKIRAKAIRDGHLTDKDNLTQSGFLMIEGK